MYEKTTTGEWGNVCSMKGKSIIKNSVKIILCILLFLVLVQGVQAAETYVSVTQGRHFDLPVDLGGLLT